MNYFIFKYTDLINDDCSDLMFRFLGLGMSDNRHASSGILRITFIFNVYKRFLLLSRFFTVLIFFNSFFDFFTSMLE